MEGGSGKRALQWTKRKNVGNPLINRTRH